VNSALKGETPNVRNKYSHLLQGQDHSCGVGAGATVAVVPFLVLANLLLAEHTSTISDHSPESPHSGLMQRLNTALVVDVSERVSVRMDATGSPTFLPQAGSDILCLHTFLGPPASAIANIRPFGDGTACQIS
jgi:hypothetical protein